MTIRVLTDAIHADLYESLRILFEDRYGWELYRPIGMDWYDTGLWRFERERLGDQVAKQFLAPWHDDLPVPPQGAVWTASNGHYRRASHTHPGTGYKLVTMDQARELKPDIIISSLAANDPGLKTFAQEVGAHFGVHVGNQGQECMWGAAEFAMLSSTTPDIKPWMPHVYYRQEFSLDLFYADGGAEADRDWVMSRVQCQSSAPGYDVFRAVAEALPEVRFTWHGHCDPRDDLWGGDSPTTALVAAEMHRAGFAWHAKTWSDGYGHVIHNWAAIGRPMLVTADYYADKLAGPLFVDGVTSFNLQRATGHEAAEFIRRLLGDEELWRSYCLNAAQRFREVVNFDEEADQLRAMFDGILSDRVRS